MASNVVQMPSMTALRTPIGHIIRTGETSYKRLENLHAEGKFPAKAVIFDASKARFQKEFIQALKADGADVILDTKVAELSEVGRYRGTAADTPWALNDRPLEADDFARGSNFHLYGQVARSAVELGVTVVMAPTHFLRNGALDPWLAIDVGGVERLRAALDREGGHDIAIDYPLIIPHTRLQNMQDRIRLLQALRGLPFDNLLVRLSGFGANAGPLSVKRTFLAIGELQSLDRPVILDHVGGLVGLSAIAFGFASGIAHGIGERDSFDARNWHQAPKKRDPDGSFGRGVYIPVPGLDRSFLAKDLQSIASTPKGRRLISCDDRRCCPHGLASMIEHPRAHIAKQKFRSIDDLFSVPDTRRASHFMSVDMRNAERKAGDLARLNTGNNKLDAALARGRKRIDSMARMYETLSESNRPAPSPIKRRNIPNTASGRESQ